MTTREQWILYLVAGTFIVSLLIVWILIRRGRTYRQPNARQVELMRSQNSNEHGAHEEILRRVEAKIDRQSTRFGFLDNKDQDPPPVNERKKP